MRKSLTKDQRLCKRGDVARIFSARAQRFSQAGLGLRFLRNNLSYNRVVFAPAKSVGSAVVRNRIKRWLRHDYAAISRRLQVGYDLALVVQPHAAHSHQTVKLKLYRLLRQSALIADE